QGPLLSRDRTVGQSPVLQGVQRLGSVRVYRGSQGRAPDPTLAGICLLQSDRPALELEGQSPRWPQAAAGGTCVRQEGSSISPLPSASRGALRSLCPPASPKAMRDGRGSVVPKTKAPDSSLPRLAFKLRTEGFAWLKSRLASEVAFPSTRIGQSIHLFARRGLAVAAAIPRAVRRSVAAAHPHAHEVLFAFYDLQVAPVTFDFLWFLAAADLERRRLGLKSVHVVIVPGGHDGVRRERDDYELVIDATARQARIQNILIQACRVLPSCGGLTLATSREEAAFLRSVVAHHILPVDYEPALPVFPGPHSCLQAARQGQGGIACLRAPAEELRAVDAWAKTHAGSRRLVAITLRRYSYMPARNSNLPAWFGFARGLDAGR